MTYCAKVAFKVVLFFWRNVCWEETGFGGGSSAAPVCACNLIGHAKCLTCLVLTLA